MDTSATPTCRPIRISNHAVERLRLRAPITRSWHRAQCVSWLTQALQSSSVTFSRSNGDIYSRTALKSKFLYLIARIDDAHHDLVVTTVLPFAFAQRNLSRR